MKAALCFGPRDVRAVEVEEPVIQKVLIHMKSSRFLPLSRGAKASAFPIGAWLGVCFYLREGSGRISYQP